MSFSRMRQQLQERASAHLLRTPLIVDSPQDVIIRSHSQKLLNFASNDYLGFANHEASIAAFKQSADQYGVGSGASHLISGHQKPHAELESALAEFVDRESAITFASGYAANLGLLQALAQKGDLIIADKLNHASLIDGAKLSAADSLRYPHCDLAALEKRLKQSPANKFVVTDSVFSMDGDIAPLKEIARLCQKYAATLVVDDAHGFGVLGAQGKGCTEYFQLDSQSVPVYMATLGKALGGYGAFVAGDQILIDYLRQFARTYVYTTAMPAAIASANMANLNTLKSNQDKLKNLMSNMHYFREQCREKQIRVGLSHTAIQPIMIGDNAQLIALDEKLKSCGVLVGAIRPPTVPKNSARLRVTLSASHTKEQIARLVEIIKQSLQELKIVQPSS